MSLWTPSGEHPVERPGASTPGEAPPRDAPTPPTPGATSLDDLSPEERARFGQVVGLCYKVNVRLLDHCFGRLVDTIRAAGGPGQTLVDVASGLAIALPVFWLFTKLLAINLPGLTGTGWI